MTPGRCIHDDPLRKCLQPLGGEDGGAGRVAVLTLEYLRLAEPYYQAYVEGSALGRQLINH